MKSKKKQITLQDLANKIDGLATKDDLKAFVEKDDIKGLASKADLKPLATKTGLTEGLESLARMVSNGFENTATKDDISKLDRRMGTMESKMGTLESKMENLESGQENIELRLISLAPNFEVKDLKKRVDKIEEKIGIK